jgi:hypothetical protein
VTSKGTRPETKGRTTCWTCEVELFRKVAERFTNVAKEHEAEGHELFGRWFHGGRHVD